MTSGRFSLKLFVIFLIVGLSVLKTEAHWFEISEKQNRPTLITAARPVIKESEPRSEEQIKSGMAILEGTKCGKSNNALVDKSQKIPQLFEFPWMALLVYLDGNSKITDCDGSLISERYVLTAAHCIRLKNKTLVSVRLGEYDTMNKYDCIINETRRKCSSPVQEIDVEEAIYHQGFNPTSISFSYDIGIIRLKTRAIFHSNVIPICLPITQDSKVFTNEWMFIAGWNKLENGTKSNLPFQAVVPTIDSKQCEGIHIFVDINEKHLCVGDDNDLINSYCKGDSGTSMFLSAPYGEKQRFVQYGIVSLYGSFCNNSLPHLYVKVQPYLPWIAGNIYY